ncbi:DNA-processing protein DprA [Promicromonospora sp. NPDC057138]|uniref:DNA-processing protein DprA n=1 Tax=Promicromonospora sp. NPDC057138 TaxID=3346031 RepID=UPI003637F006
MEQDMEQDLGEIAGMAADERTARIILALGCAPGDELAAELVAEHGPVSLVQQIASGALHSETMRLARWRETVARRLDLSEISHVLRRTQELDLGTLIPSDPSWPAPAGNAAAPPLVLWTRGDPSVLVDRQPRVALIGSRIGTRYGTRVTRELATELVQRGVTIVTTGGHGIDTTALLGALYGDGHAVAVLPRGLDRPHPSGNADVFDRLTTDGGVLVSATPPGRSSNRTRLQVRDQLVATLADAVVVTESSHHSPVLRIATAAVRLGRPLGAVPGEITSPASAGTNELLRQHLARMITHATDAMNLLTAPRRTIPPTSTADRSAERDLSAQPPSDHGAPSSRAWIPL